MNKLDQEIEFLSTAYARNCMELDKETSKIQGWLEGVGDFAAHLNVNKQINEHPLATVGCAIGAGALLGVKSSSTAPQERIVENSRHAHTPSTERSLFSQAASRLVVTGLVDIGLVLLQGWLASAKSGASSQDEIH